MLATMLGLAACSTLGDSADAPAPVRPTAGILNADSSVTAPQIYRRDAAGADLTQRQIEAVPAGAGLSVEQLRTYVDRCSPSAGGAAFAPGVDCSEITLRVERLFRNDNEVIEALSVLDRIGTPDRRTGSDAELFVQRALASGAISVGGPLTESEPEEEIDAALQGFDTEAIVAATTGR